MSGGQIYKDQLRLWVLEESDDEITWPTKAICDVAANLAETLPPNYHMVPDGNGGIVFHPPNKHDEKYHVWENGEIHRIFIVDGRVVHRDIIQGPTE